jgi:hypothetical protein
MISRGAFTQQDACRTRGPGRGTDNSPQAGYTQMWNALNNPSDPNYNAATDQAGRLDWSSDITWNNDPAVNP